MDRPTVPGIVSVANETSSTATKITKEGKSIRYELRIIQQPERARACGAGAKASADRRPVDPPPIIQLKVFELLPNHTEEEITLSIPANYFVFATLERGRQVAQPRGMQDPNKMPVLTGTSVAGQQIYERPEAAIYFIFPDLSVRHEGKYRLSFSLYEQLKRTEDDDRTSHCPDPSQEHITHRMEVKSSPFDVFSAKRFPGLTESTTLSRTFAEQGCRVRIRRDVRMRRRDTKAGKDWDEYDDDHSHLPRLSHTPDPYSHAQMPPQPIEPIRRPRSAGSQGHHSLHASVSRRTSLNDMNHSGYRPHTPNHGAYPQPSPYNPAQGQHFSHPQYMQPPPPPPPPPPPQFSATGYPSSASMSAAPQQSSYYGYAPAPAPAPLNQPYSTMSTSYDPGMYSHHRNSGGDFSVQSDQRRSSMQSNLPNYTQSPYNPVPSLSHAPQAFAQQPQPLHPDAQLQTSTSQHHNSIDSYANRAAPPPEPVQPPTRVATPTPPPLTAKPTFGTTLPPLSTSFPHGKLEAASPSSAAPLSAFSASLSTPTDTHKRSYGSTFPTAWQNLPNKQGGRPGEVSTSGTFLAPDNESDDGPDFGDSMTRFYKRACGRTVERQIP